MLKSQPVERLLVHQVEVGDVLILQDRQDTSEGLELLSIRPGHDEDVLDLTFRGGFFYIVPKDLPAYRLGHIKECTCDCHQPGVYSMHWDPCCEGEECPRCGRYYTTCEGRQLHIERCKGDSQHVQEPHR